MKTQIKEYNFSIGNRWRKRERSYTKWFLPSATIVDQEFDRETVQEKRMRVYGWQPSFSIRNDLFPIRKSVSSWGKEENDSACVSIFLFSVSSGNIEETTGAISRVSSKTIFPYCGHCLNSTRVIHQKWDDTDPYCECSTLRERSR